MNPRGLDETLTPLEHARNIAGLAQEKLAQDVLILDMRPVCSYTDFFVLATGQNPRQTKAIWDEVHERLKHDEGALPRSVAGEPEGRWIVADYRRSRASTTGSRTCGATCRASSSTRPPSSALERGYTWGSGAVAQLGERLAGSQKVTGSSPVGSTLDV